MRMPVVSDTHPDIERLQLDLMRQAPAWRVADLLEEALNQGDSESAR